MDTHERSGHLRTSVLGKVHRVKGHTYERFFWPSAEPSKLTVAEREARKFEVTSLIRPTRCPQCRREVYFYSNEHGSRVFFNELGPTWDKHGCTDSGKDVDFEPSSGLLKQCLKNWRREGWIPLACLLPTIPLRDGKQKLQLYPCGEATSIFKVIFGGEVSADWARSIILGKPDERPNYWRVSVFDITRMASFECTGRIEDKPRNEITWEKIQERRLLRLENERETLIRSSRSYEGRSDGWSRARAAELIQSIEAIDQSLMQIRLELAGDNADSVETD